jgi:S1-C subfamily serine protease
MGKDSVRQAIRRLLDAKPVMLRGPYMKSAPRKRILIVLGTLTALAAPSPTLSSTLPEIARIAKESTYLVVNLNIVDELHGQGTGFVLGPERLFVTNFHVIDGARRVGIMLPDGRVFELQAPIAHDRSADIAIFKLPAELQDVPYLSLYQDEIETGLDILVFGYPSAIVLGVEPTLTQGIVSSYRASLEDYGPVVQIDASISGGSSGSPVLTPRGEVLGVATASLIDGQNMNFAIPASTLAHVIRRSEVNARQGGSASSVYSNTSETHSLPQSREQKTPVVSSDLLTLEVEAIDSTWVEIKWDVSGYFQGVIPRGEKRIWHAHDNISVHSGRAHGARYWFQGHLLGKNHGGRLGKATSVLRFRADATGAWLLGENLLPLETIYERD